MLGSDAIASFAGLIGECRSRDEYERERLAWLERAIGFDASYFGAAAPEQTVKPVVSGVSAARVEHCEAHADRYWQDRLTLQRVALQQGGVVADYEALSARERDRMPFYREVVAGHGIRVTAVGLLRWRGQVSGSVFLGRTSRSTRFGSELTSLRRVLPLLALGEAVHAPTLPQVTVLDEGLDQLTARERVVLSLLCRGETNAQIAAQLGTSPLTVKNQVSAILFKTKAANRTQLVARATRRRAAD